MCTVNQAALCPRFLASRVASLVSENKPWEFQFGRCQCSAGVCSANRDNVQHRFSVDAHLTVAIFGALSDANSIEQLRLRFKFGLYASYNNAYHVANHCVPSFEIFKDRYNCYAKMRVGQNDRSAMMPSFKVPRTYEVRLNFVLAFVNKSLIRRFLTPLPPSPPFKRSVSSSSSSQYY
jgi:hypothetical protein